MVWRPSVNIVTLYRFQFLALPIRKKKRKDFNVTHSSHVFDLFFLSSVNAYKTITYQKKTIQRTYCENICLTFRRLAIGGLKKEYAVGRCHKWAISNGIPSFVRNDPILVNVITAAIIFAKTIFIAKFLKKKKKNSKQQLFHKILWRTWISYITVCWLPQGNEIRNTNWLSRANRNFISNKSSLLNRWGGGESGKVSQSSFLSLICKFCNFLLNGWKTAAK